MIKSIIKSDNERILGPGVLQLEQLTKMVVGLTLKKEFIWRPTEIDTWTATRVNGVEVQ